MRRALAISLISGLAMTTSLTAPGSAAAQALAGLGDYYVVGAPGAVENVLNGAGARVCAPSVASLPGGLTHYRPPVGEIANGLANSFCEAAIVTPGEVDGVLADAQAQGLNVSAISVDGSPYIAGMTANAGMAAPMQSGLAPPPPSSSFGAAPPAPPGAPAAAPAPAQSQVVLGPAAAPRTIIGDSRRFPSPPVPSLAPERGPIDVGAPILGPTTSAGGADGAGMMTPIGPAVTGDATDSFREAYEMLVAGDNTSAANTFASGLNVDPSNYVAHYYLGVAYERMGRPDYAVVQYQRVSELWPDTEEGAAAASDLQRLGEADSSIIAGNPFRADEREQVIRYDSRRRARPIEDVFESSAGARMMRERNRAISRARAERAVRAQAPRRSPELQRLAASGRIASAGGARFDSSNFGADPSRPTSRGAFASPAAAAPLVVAPAAPSPAAIETAPAPTATGEDATAPPPMVDLPPPPPATVMDAPMTDAPAMDAPVMDAPPPLTAPMPAPIADAPPPMEDAQAPFAPMMDAPPPLAPPPIADAAPIAAPMGAPMSAPADATTVDYQDGSRYVGQVSNGQPEGMGDMTYADGSRYVGRFRSGLRDGQGRLTLTDGMVYEGGFAQDAIQGRGVLSWPDGARYEGDFQSGRRTGDGVYVWPSGSRYEGRFEDGVIVGPGVFTAATGERYQGQFQDGRRTGRGVLELPSGERYEGDVVDGQPNGRGVYTWPGGQRYEGEFRAGQINGDGTMFYTDGQTRSGQWSNGQPVG